MRYAIEFDEAAHRYRVNGRAVPSVTQVLEAIQDFSMVDHDTLARAAEFGAHVHEAIHLFDNGTLDEADLDPALLPYLNQWKKFLDESGAVVLASEVRIAHRAGFAGTLDKLIHWRKRDRLLDLKSGVFFNLSVGLQTSAYKEGLFDCGYWPRKPLARGCLHLTGTSYRHRPLDDPADWPRFVSLLNVHKLKAA